ncbi:protein serine/threonine phosphatase 2C [Backusella circina FSU 941]|nr:protein serine/threonine phosphatase 2C [Backusella circina FSU 941]
MRRSFSTSCVRHYKNYYLTKGVNNSLLRLNLENSRQLLGLCSSRGTRTSNEDKYSAVTLELPPGKNLQTMEREANRAYIGIFDGHGGPVVSEWLANKLHERIETITLDDFANTLSILRSYRGYFRRFPIPTCIKQFVDEQGHVRHDKVKDINDLTIEQRLTLAFLDADTIILQKLKGEMDDSHEDNEGSTGSVAIIEPRDKQPFWSSEEYDIIIGHVGDTRILLCDTNSGEVISLTTGDHHPGNPTETDRLRKYAGFVTTDSWGDERIMGMLATSRAFGDAKLKRYGVSAEPDVVRYKITKENPAAFMVFVTDGITSVMSDQEVVDYVKEYKDPTISAKKLVDAADQLHSDDNTTAVVVRLKDWGKRMHDYTHELRTYRLENSSMSKRHFTGAQSLEDELLGKGYLKDVPLGSSLAAELESATHDPMYDELDSTDQVNPSKLASLAMEKRPPNALTNGDPNNTSPILSPLQWSASTGPVRSRRSSFSSTWSSVNDPEDDDPFEVLKRQLEDLNTAVWETKTLHKRLFKTLALDETLQDFSSKNSFAPPFEYVIQSVVNLIERKSRDRERQTSYLRNLDSSLRKEQSLMSIEALRDLENLLSSVRATLTDHHFSYENPLPSLRNLNIETTAATESLEELKEIMYVNKRQVQELNSRLRSIAKTVHEVRKDMRRINKFLEDKDDEDPVVLEKGEAAERVKEIMWGLDDVDAESTKKLEQMQHFWDNVACLS